MAQLLSLTITSSFDWNATTENTSSAGYMWFDNGDFKISRNAGVWSTGPNMICGRAGQAGLKGSGTQNAALSFGGTAPSVTNLTEEYNGSSWSAGGVLPLIIWVAGGAGTQNAALQVGGETPGAIFKSETSEYDGSSWSAGGSLITGRGRGAAAGFQNSGITWGGRTTPGQPLLSCTEEYNGSSWSTGGALGIGASNHAGTGTQNATLSAGGQHGSVMPAADVLPFTLEYNGTSWSSGNCQIHRRQLTGALGGNQSEAVLAKGNIEYESTALTEGWDGITWTSQNTANLSSECLSGAGSPSALIVHGGPSYPYATSVATELYTSQLHARSL